MTYYVEFWCPERYALDQRPWVRVAQIPEEIARAVECCQNFSRLRATHARVIGTTSPGVDGLYNLTDIIVYECEFKHSGEFLFQDGLPFTLPYYYGRIADPIVPWRQEGF